MGDAPERSVIDPDGRVWGWDNLFVADASVFPTSLGVNPQVTTMAVGLTIGEAVAERLG
jgi:choline dehydrogenase-like flavoprotein